MYYYIYIELSGTDDDMKMLESLALWDWLYINQGIIK